MCVCYNCSRAKKKVTIVVKSCREIESENSARAEQREFVVAVIIVLFLLVRDGERTASMRRRQNRSLPKLSPGGLACRNAM